MKRLIFLTGAGLSAESGVPTFRSNGGLWFEYDINEVCNIHKFKENYNQVHDFYNKRRTELANVEPNLMHCFISECQNMYKNTHIITSNVDDLLERAGCKDVNHVHGFLPEIVLDWNTQNYRVENIGYSEFDYKNYDGIAKPQVVFFGECFKYENQRKMGIYDQMEYLLSTLNSNDLVFIIGASYQVISWDISVAMATSAYVVDVNIKLPTNHIHFDHCLTTGAVDSVDEMRKIIDNWLDLPVKSEDEIINEYL